MNSIPKSYEEFIASVFESYNNGNFQGALEILVGDMDAFPKYSQSVYFAKMCLTAVLGNLDEAVSVFEEAVELGLWFPETMLRNDSDLSVLQGNLDFERLLEICIKRRAVAQADSTPKRLLYPPQSDAPYPLVIALHGNNGNAERFQGFWGTAVSHGWGVLLPQSSQVSGPDRYVWDERDWAVKEVLDHYQQVRSDIPVQDESVVVGGFSMGGGIAIWMALTGLIKTQGFIAVAPSLPDIDNLRSVVDRTDLPAIRGYFIVGDKDTRAVELTAKVSELMQSRGLECRIETHSDLGHAFPENFDVILLNALSFVSAERS